MNVTRRKFLLIAAGTPLAIGMTGCRGLASSGNGAGSGYMHTDHKGNKFWFGNEPPPPPTGKQWREVGTTSDGRIIWELV